jgi:ABC-2 type transport system permease protein
MMIKSLWGVTKYTFLELYRSRILSINWFFGIVIFIVAYIISELSYGDLARTALDISFGLLSMALMGISIFLGSSLIKKEIESKTLYLLLSRPLSRPIFLLGRVLGLVLILLVITLILGFFSLVIYSFMGGVLKVEIFWAILFIFLEASLLLNLVLFISVFANTTITVLFSLVVYVSMYAIENALGTLFVAEKESLKAFLTFISTYLPNFNKFNLKEIILFDIPIESHYFWGTTLYGLGYMAVLFSIAALVFQKKELE